MGAYIYQDLSRFKIPPEFRGRSPEVCQLWRLVQTFLFRPSPQMMFGWRNFLLKAFGAKIGRGAQIRSTVSIISPWKINVGDNTWINDDVVLYSLGDIHIGSNSVVSQRSYLCAGSYNLSRPTFDIYALPIVIGDQVWIATDVFIGPGVTIGEGTVVGARSSVYKDLPAGYICYGNPAAPVRLRRTSTAPVHPQPEAESTIS